MPKQSVLVLGSKGHDGSTCLNWLEPFPNIEEYDSLIINLQSLNQEQYDKISLKIKNMQESVFSMLDTGREVFCILSDFLVPTPQKLEADSGYVELKSVDNSHFRQLSNYSWLPSPLYPDSNKKGTSIILKNPRFAEYFRYIHGWHFELYFRFEGDSYLSTYYLKELHPIATNKSDRTIACTLINGLEREKMLNNKSVGMIHLLPPPDDDSLHKCVDCIIDIIQGSSSKNEPFWRKDIDIIIDRQLKETLKEKQAEQSKVQREILEIEKQIDVYDNYRNLLTETGDSLERIVRKTLGDLGINVSPTKPGFPADLINNEIAIEITGIKGSVGVDSNKITQTGRFYQNFRKQEKVILIVNTYMGLQPKERMGKINFTPEMAAYLKALSVSYLTTNTLFEVWKKTVTGEIKKEQAKRLIFETVGEITI